MISLRAQCDQAALGVCEASCVNSVYFLHATYSSQPHLDIFVGPGYRRSADGRFATAKLLVPECLDACELITIRRFFQKTWRYMDVYRYVCMQLHHKHRLLIMRLSEKSSLHVKPPSQIKNIGLIGGLGSQVISPRHWLLRT